MLSECPSEDQLAAFVAGVRSSETDDLRSHLYSCETCRRAVSAIAATPTHPAFGAGTRLGRFTMKRLLGEGAMGEVWAARDRELGREVAIKLLRVSSDRLRREAQAMARVRHPNVVAIYDLGWIDDHAFCAMELVDGETLRAYLATPRPWRAVLRIAVAAGRGLAAAHRTGVIHRDIKPENVLIARDGRTLVSDFGLAKLAAPDDTATDAGRAPTAPFDASGTHLTTTGALIGTPAYMAPEQLAGEAASCSAISSRSASWCTRRCSEPVRSRRRRSSVCAKRSGQAWHARPRCAASPSACSMCSSADWQPSRQRAGHRWTRCSTLSSARCGASAGG
jgi:serine/threonine protein kinase